ncbi:MULTISPECIES: hypothetical protein [Pyrobaculum]|uniref:Transmembrane protein n=1 Tax=Pyrobaculum arsenaticum TaxID=121277 RepID=A0A7L4P872_9CREN|nr:hypothetical protein [Pyrobaculum arsenaticum]MCY0890387.1 hypothetical protein [Pyrobaculum arsenaticum]NYR14657.1 hypothetical protein [Pyrobaculum arsenaticum]
MAPPAASLYRLFIPEIVPFLGVFSLCTARYFFYAPQLLAATPLSAYGFAVAWIVSPLLGYPRWLALAHLAAPYLSLVLGPLSWWFLLLWLLYLMFYIFVLPLLVVRPARIFYKPFVVALVFTTPLAAVPYTAGLLVPQSFLMHLGIPPEYARLSWVRYIHDVVLLRVAYYYVERYMRSHADEE